MWKSEAWDAMRLCFPSENKRSGKLLMTRNTEVARDVGTENLSLQMDLMGPDESWNLFKSIAFANKALPSDFETIGKQIAEKCHGLPLTIAVIAGLLKSKSEIEDWENVAKDVKSFFTNDPDKQCSRVLGLSYDHLTSDLKASLLHFGIFREDSEMLVKNLMRSRSWMAEGFLKLENDLEGEAEKCLQEIVDRCLVLVCKKSLDGTRIRSCKVHDLIYDLAGDEIDYCRYCLYRNLLTPAHHQLRDHDNNDLWKRTRSIFSFLLKDSYFILKSELIHFKILKVLELRYIEIDNFPLQILNLTWLRYLSLQCDENLDIPQEICRLWNLQTFIVQGSQMGVSVIKITFPEEIWGLMQLRHLKAKRVYLPNPPSVSADKGICGYEIESNGLLNNLVHLQQLETLSFILCYNRLPASEKAFPETLKKLKLRLASLTWSYLDIIAELPNLEVLKLMTSACDGEEWHPNVRGFDRLKLLSIENNDLKYWKATNDNFPFLERLMIRSCQKLKEIPIEFADIHTLQLIELRKCPPELGESAARIHKEQEDLGNNPVDVRISDSFEGE
ncbi:hypothetical protein P3S68_008730 [Capsicum galapagoense]